MKKIYTDEQVVGFIREAEKTEVTIAEFCRQKGFNEGTFYQWKRRFGSMQVAEVKRLRELESENARLKRLLADRMIEIDRGAGIARKKVVTVERKREAVVFLKTKEVSERRSCQLIFLARATCQYRIRRKPDEEFENQVKELAFANPRYGYRRVHALLRGGGQKVNRKRVVRVRQKFALPVPRSKRSKKRVRQIPPVMSQATRPNEVWTYDFVLDRDAAGSTTETADDDGRVHTRRLGNPSRTVI